ncbi:MAG: hypothetical protein ABWY58_02325 [Aeromicrobium sp.]
MSEDFSPHSVVIVCQRLADRLGPAEGVVIVDPTPRYHACAFFWVRQIGGSIE